jgi:hypothetical protein
MINAELRDPLRQCHPPSYALPLRIPAADHTPQNPCLQPSQIDAAQERGENTPYPVVVLCARPESGHVVSTWRTLEDIPLLESFHLLPRQSNQDVAHIRPFVLPQIAARFLDLKVKKVLM